MNIENLTVIAKIDGQACFILIPDDKHKLLLRFVASISENEELKAVKAPDSLTFTTLEDAI